MAVACAAKRLGIPAKIFVPTVSSPVKIDRIRADGADVVIIGDLYDDALAASERYATSPTPCRSTPTIRSRPARAGDAGTRAIRAGSGCGHGAGRRRRRRPDRRCRRLVRRQDTRVVGVEPAAAPTLTEALKAGRPVDAAAGGVAADSLAPRRVGGLMFPIARQHVDRVVLVEDDEIVRAQGILWDAFRLVVEPGGAAALAALIAGRYRPSRDEHVAVVLCGGNAQRHGPH